MAVLFLLCSVRLDKLDTMMFQALDGMYCLKKIQRHDLGAMINFARIHEYQMRGPFPLSIDALLGSRSDSDKWIREKTEGPSNDRLLFCLIQNAGNGEIVGFVSAFLFDWRIPRCEISWMVAKAHQRMGLATICAEYLIEFLTLECGLRKVICRVAPDNEASRRLAAKLGFIEEGLHHSDFRDGFSELKDVIYYARLVDND